MRGAVTGSVAVHVALLVALFAVRNSTPMLVPGPDVVQVSLMDLPPGPIAAAPKPEPPKPDPALAEIKPVEDTGVKLEKPKPVPKKPPAEPAAKSRTEQAALPYAPVGTSGLKGQVAVDAGNFEFTYYLMLVRNQIARNWEAPAGMGAGQPVRAVVYFRIGRDGEISDVRLDESSGREFFDRSALRAVQIAGSLPPLPLGYTGSELGVHFGFEYAGP